MKRKSYISILACCVLFLFTISICSASTVKFPEPKDNNNVPDYAVWDTELGMYISTDVYKDPASGKLFDKKLKPQKYEGTEKFVDPLDTWIQSHKDSTSKVDNALINYYEEHRSKPVNNSLKSFYDPKEDPYLYNIIQLGYDYLPELFAKIANDEDSAVACTIMAAIEELTKTKNGLIAYDKDSKKLWTDEFKYKKNKAANISQYSSDTIAELGMLAIPYLCDEIDNGNKQALLAVASVLGNGKVVDEGTALSDWKKWKNNNEMTIVSIKKFNKNP